MRKGGSGLDQSQGEGRCPKGEHKDLTIPKERVMRRGGFGLDQSQGEGR